jgi:SET domain-containing protein
MIFISEKIEVKSSQIGGMGVFAKQDIKAGETLEVSYFTTLTQNFSQIDNKLKEYVFSWPKNVWGGKSVVVWGYGSLYNHSRQNNADWDTDEENNVFKFFTIKDIKSGEEIFTNYGEAYEKIVKTVN